EDQVARRGRERLVPRLVRRPAPAEDVLSPFRAEATYLVTGGLGALGLRVARWLSERGARHLVLAGRRGVTGAAEAAVEELRQGGVHVLVVRADVAVAEDVERLLKEIGERMPPLRGVVHAAGVLDDGVLLQQSWERFEKVLAPKVAGAWNLHRLTREMPLD